MTASALRTLLVPSLKGLKQNLVPGLVLQACALCVVLGYAGSKSFHALLDQIGTLKEQYGYAYSGVATAIFGGAIPFLVLLMTRQIPKGRAVHELLFYLGFWLWKGVEVDAFYRLQSLVFGNATTAVTIASKAVVDQFVYAPLWAGPTQVVFFLWKDSGFSWQVMRQGFCDQSLSRRMAVILLSTWMVWLPTVSIVYSLPGALQIPLFNLVLCFWCLLFSFISRSGSQRSTRATS